MTKSVAAKIYIWQYQVPHNYWSFKSCSYSYTRTCRMGTGILWKFSKYSKICCSSVLLLSSQVFNNIFNNWPQSVPIIKEFLQLGRVSLSKLEHDWTRHETRKNTRTCRMRTGILWKFSKYSKRCYSSVRSINWSALQSSFQ